MSERGGGGGGGMGECVCLSLSLTVELGIKHCRLDVVCVNRVMVTSILVVSECELSRCTCIWTILHMLVSNAHMSSVCVCVCVRARAISYYYCWYTDHCICAKYTCV